MSKYKYDFTRFQTIRSFGVSIFTGKITIREADKKQSNILDVILKFNDKVRPTAKADKEKRTMLMKPHMLLMKVKRR